VAIRNHAQVVERKIVKATVEYRQGPWGRVTKSREGAAGLCSRRASLVLMALLERNGVEGAKLVCLSAPREYSRLSPDLVHFLVLLGKESFDVTARRFESHAPQVSRRMFGIYKVFWEKVEEVDPDQRDSPLVGGHLDGIPANWRELADCAPPGDVIGWEYPGDWPVGGGGVAPE
jgi:hypothetical protein